MYKQLKVIHIIDSQIFGGAERYIIEVSRKLVENHKVDISLYSFKYNEFLEKESKQFNLKYDYFCHQQDCSSRFVKNKIKDLYNQNPNTIFHTHGYKTNVLVRQALWFKKALIVTTVHSTFKYWNNKIKKIVYSNLDKITSVKNKKIITVSNYIKDYYATILNKNKIITIYNGVDDEKFTPKLNELYKDEYTLINVGNLNEAKNQITLLKAFKGISNNNLRLLILGEGPQREALEQYIDRNDLQDKVQLIGSTPDVSKYLHQADLFISTSIDESFGLAIVEAMLSGVPVIASKVGGVVEVINENGTGIFYMNPFDEIELSQKIEKLINDPELSNQLSLNALSIAKEKFSLVNVTKQIYEIYQVISKDIR